MSINFFVKLTEINVNFEHIFCGVFSGSLSRKRKADGRIDSPMERIMTQFIAAQKEAAVAFNRAEDNRLKVMLDAEERRAERRNERDMAMREAGRKHQEKMMKMMFMMMNKSYQQYRCNVTPQMGNPSVVTPMSNITSSTPNSDMDNSTNSVEHASDATQ